ncbi:response regulator [Aliidiomarina taiwanensis]|uniref:Response regulator n=1 Tax=Aliidiomarina taiwanensis TaxID=946228 RepID=A0A432XAL0_9GAMM|nr:tetratricopeptide repeat-containing response regulator [Aliidiomarina taiwanensis]RUO44346.1 response regulator [Aliidiomarina taiwanensis]
MRSTLDLSKKKILIIDDQKTFQVMLKSMLLNLGALQVVTAPSGEAGLASHRQHRFDILLVDYHLGRGKNGRQVLEELKYKRLLRPDGVFILVSAENTRPMILSAIELQPDDYLMKPFSSSVLKSRLERAFRKRVTLRKVYHHLYRREYQACIEACNEHIAQEGRYKNFCLQLASELYLRVGKVDEAEQAVQVLLDEQRFSWAVLELAHIKFKKGDYEDCLPLIEEVIQSNSNAVEAFDLRAKVYEQLKNAEQALNAARRAVSLAPFSIQRQTYLAHLARHNQQFDLAKQAMGQVVELSRKSVHRDPKHLCTYIRSILDAAENSETEHQVKRYQQDATLALQRSRTEESLVYSKFDYKTLESAVMARINAYNGQLREAQENMQGVISGFLEQGYEIPKEVTPDIIIALLDIGEFERAEALSNHILADLEVDPYNKELLSSRLKGCKEQRSSFKEANKQGIQAYTEGDYLASIQHFEQALKLAPLNSGAALNYIQAALKMFEQKKSESAFLHSECERCFRIIEGLSLPKAHHRRYMQLKADYEVVVQGNGLG